jgi:hypothetical protein
MLFNYVQLYVRQQFLTDLKLGENTHWYNPGQVIYYAISKGISKNQIKKRSLAYYIDPYFNDNF